jgi:hypothetical protein
MHPGGACVVRVTASGSGTGSCMIATLPWPAAVCFGRATRLWAMRQSRSHVLMVCGLKGAAFVGACAPFGGCRLPTPPRLPRPM